MGDTFFKATGDFFVGPRLWAWMNPEVKQKLAPVDTGTPQGADYGVPMQMLIGRDALQGNIIWLRANTIDQRKVKVKTPGGGKGGGSGSTKTKEIHCFATFAMALAIPVKQAESNLEIKRIWCSDKLIYSGHLVSGATTTLSIGGETCTMTFYGGDQTVIDPLMEADLGTANTPDYHGLAYVVFYDFPLKSFGNTLQGTALKFDVGVFTAGDLNWDNVVLLLDMDHLEDGATAYTDPLSSAHPIKCRKTGRAFTLTGAASWSLAHPDDGYSSLYIPAGATGYLSAATDETFSMDLDEFTIDIKVYIPSSNPNNVILFDSLPLNEEGDRWRSFILYFNNGDLKVYTQRLTLSFVCPQPGGGVWNYNEWTDVRFTVSRPDPINHPTKALLAASINNHWGTYQYGWDGTISDFVLTYSNMSGTQYPPAEAGGINFGVVANDPTYAAIDAAYFRKIRFTRSVVRDSNDYTFTQFSMPYSRIRDNVPTLLQEVLPSVFGTCDTKLPAMIDQTAGIYTETNDILFGSILSADTRALLDALQKIYNFDIVCSGYGFKCVRRQNSTPVFDFTIPWQHVIQESGNMVNLEYEMGTQLPQDYTVTFMNPEREYATDIAPSSFPQVDSGNTENFQSPLAMTFVQGQTIADNLRRNSWQDKNIARFKLPFKASRLDTGAEVQYQTLEPSDVIKLQTIDGTVVTLLVLSVKDANGKIELECGIATTVNAAFDIGDIEIATAPLTAPLSVGIFLDIPLVSPAMDTLGIAWAACAAADGPWIGAGLYRDIGSSNYMLIDETSIDAFIATCPTPLSEHDCDLIDYGTLFSIVPLLTTIDIVSVTKELLLAGQNLAAYGAAGRWEIIGYQNATLNNDTSYTLTGLLRGLYGTEWATGLHEVDDYFVALDSGNINFFITTADLLNTTFNYKLASYNTTVDAASVITNNYTAANLKPYSGCKGKGERDGSSNLTISWYRRSRIDNSWRSGTDIAIGETAESYEVDIMNGTTVVRTITASTPSVSYSAANQTTDFGSPQSSLTVRIYQIAPIVGRGFKYEVTV